MELYAFISNDQPLHLLPALKNQRRGLACMNDGRWPHERVSGPFDNEVVAQRLPCCFTPVCAPHVEETDWPRRAGRMRWLLIVLCAISFHAHGVILPYVRVDVTVLDEAGAPLANAMVRGNFLGGRSDDGSVDRTRTNSSGRATVSGRSIFPVDVSAVLEGYYASASSVNTRETVDGEVQIRDQAVSLVLKEKRNPIPLYAKRYSGEIPVAEQWIGFDLEKADWVAPYGKGGRSDIHFWFQGGIDSFDSGQGELRLRFSEHDGAAEISDISAQNELKVPHLAHIEGYVSEEKVWREAIRKEVEGRPNRNRFYFLRLRTVIDARHEIEAANYGKLYGDVFFSLRGRQGGMSRLQFTYYFNPTPNDRNLEFDAYRNLFRDLPHDDRVWEP